LNKEGGLLEHSIGGAAAAVAAPGNLICISYNFSQSKHHIFNISAFICIFLSYVEF
jgi:hypothetical protein